MTERDQRLVMDLIEFIEHRDPSSFTEHELKVLVAEIRHLHQDFERLNALINNPHTEDFLKAVQIEAAHQRERWGEEHDATKGAEMWLWNTAYLATKALQAERYGDQEKYLHHIITTAALCANWHRHAVTDNCNEGEKK